MNTRIEEIRERLGKITPGKWKIHHHSSTSVEATSIRNVIANCGGWGGTTYLGEGEEHEK